MSDINMNWVERLHAPRYIWSQIAANNPRRGILCREEKSQQQLLTWDVETGDTRPLTLPVSYLLNATLSPDGEFVTYLVPHPTHADVYQYVRVPFEGGEPQPMALTALMNASPHIEEAYGRIGFTAVTGNGYSVQIWTPDGKKPLFSYESEVLAYGPSLSFDGKIAVIATMQSAESETTILEAYDIDTGAKISQLALPETPLEAVKFAPVEGDTRLLVQARAGLLTRPLVWDVRMGSVDRFEPLDLEGVDEEGTYGVWDWVDDQNILLHESFGQSLYFVTYNLLQRSRFEHDVVIGHPTLAYWHKPDIIFHAEMAGLVPFMDIREEVSYETRVMLPEQPKKIFYAQLINAGGKSLSVWIPNVLIENMSTVASQRAKVVALSFNESGLSFSECAAWVGQDLLCFKVDLEPHPFNKEILREATELTTPEWCANNLQMLLTAHNMAAALALLALHDDSSLWAGGVVVRPILDWVILYESVSPPEKAMMRLWFGGSPTEKPEAWREASPLRQTKPLTVPVKLLYHPYDSLTPIQHIQTYAANNPTVELIDISRDMVGPAHEQQERLITRMLQAGLPLLQSGT